jgi:hypothetical protein
MPGSGTGNNGSSAKRSAATAQKSEVIASARRRAKAENRAFTDATSDSTDGFLGIANNEKASMTNTENKMFCHV